MTRHFTIIANKGSGSHAGGELHPLLRDHLEKAGHRLTLVELDPTSGKNLDDVCRDAVRLAKARGDIVVAAGGDGTLNTVAAICHQENAAMGVIPMGTFNYFARDHNIPLGAVDAINLLKTGILTSTRIGEVNGQAFLVNASLGLYGQVIRNRETDKATFGRHRIVAALSAIKTLFHAGRSFKVSIDGPNGTVHRRTLMVFICNNHFQMAQLGLAGGDDNPPGTLDVVIMKPTRWWQMLRILFLSAIGRLKLEERLEEFTAPAFTIDKKRRQVEVVIDGEIVTLTPPLRFRALSAGLQVIQPPRANGAV